MLHFDYCGEKEFRSDEEVSVWVNDNRIRITQKLEMDKAPVG